MADYTIVFARSASKELRAFDTALALRILKRIDALAKNPRPDGVAKLEGASDLWRIRVGEWRVVFRIDDHERIVDITSVRHRREVYR